MRGGKIRGKSCATDDFMQSKKLPGKLQEARGIIFSCCTFRPRTESMLIKKHLTLAVCATQIVFLVAIQGYKEEVCEEVIK